MRNKPQENGRTSLQRLLWTGFSIVMAALVLQGGMSLWSLTKITRNETQVIADVGGLVEDVHGIEEGSLAASAEAKSQSDQVRSGLVATMKDGAGNLRVLERSVGNLVESTKSVIVQLEEVLENESLDEDTAGIIEGLIFDVEDGYDRGRKESLPVVRTVVAKLMAGVEQAKSTASDIASLETTLAEFSATSTEVAAKGDRALAVAERSRAQAASSMTLISVVIGVAVLLGVAIPVIIIRRLSGVLGRLAGDLDNGADEVRSAAAQVASSSQSLAAGACEQASSLEETSSALEQLAAMTRTNAENAKQSKVLSDEARTAAEGGNETVVQLNSAMTAINDSAGEISKIIKVIEAIAFQTNLLALNAAVEAARAGEHGKGFAVVADEVRNLAQRAAGAAKETTGLIEQSVLKAQEGSRVAGSVAGSLGEIATNVASVSDLVTDIAKASSEQALGVEQINTAVSQMDNVTQQNAAGAEESASASEQLSGQSEMVKSMVSDLAAVVGGSDRCGRIRKAQLARSSAAVACSDGRSGEFAGSQSKDEATGF